MSLDNQKDIEGQIDLLDEIALKIPTILSWKEFIAFREDFIKKYKIILDKQI
jgi:hypothetical protein